jgi:hypothetical protein
MRSSPSGAGSPSANAIRRLSEGQRCRGSATSHRGAYGSCCISTEIVHCCSHRIGQAAKPGPRRFAVLVRTSSRHATRRCAQYRSLVEQERRTADSTRLRLPDRNEPGALGSAGRPAGGDARIRSIGEVSRSLWSSHEAAPFSPIQQSQSMVRYRPTLPVLRESRSRLRSGAPTI